jgi:para-aminobenzoate synthetase/4-amino-4-deoxychorismate lyase
MSSPGRPIAEMLSGDCVLLEDRLSPDSCAKLYRHPRAIICCTRVEEIGHAFEALQQGLKDGLHAAGFLSYELGYALEPKLAARLPLARDVPLLWFGLFSAPENIAATELDEAFARLAPPPPIEDLHFGHDQATHSRKVVDILELIRNGDIYQANLTFPISFRLACDPARLYAALRSRQPVAHGGIAVFGGRNILSVSPELFLDVKGDIATTRPMKGTSPRGATAGADAALRRRLLEDPKQRAENLMIVDLLRNDLSRIAEFGTVRVPSLFEVETYPGFLAMSSTITATLRKGTSLRARFAALFPCGSIVGAPKIRAAEVLRDLEQQPRGVYTGALGAIAPNGDMRFNVAIRTAIVDADGCGRYGVGGGIVAESHPTDEYQEALLKAQVLTGLAEPYDLIETFRWDPTEGFIRLANHLDRLTRSALQLGFVIERAKIECELSNYEKKQLKTYAHRIRLVLTRAGSIHIAASPLPATPQAKLRVCIAEARLDPANPFLRHKTSLRDVYETAFSRATDTGFDEAIFLNTRGDIAEASRNTVFIAVDGRLLTPPLSSGVLPGVLRHILIARGDATEQILTLSHIEKADRFFLGNSLHGLREGLLF